MKWNRTDCFHEGQVWQTSRGTMFKVMDVSSGQATLRLGRDGTGRRVRRPWDAVANWYLEEDTESKS